MALTMLTSGCARCLLHIMARLHATDQLVAFAFNCTNIFHFPFGILHFAYATAQQTRSVRISSWNRSFHKLHATHLAKHRPCPPNSICLYVVFPANHVGILWCTVPRFSELPLQLPLQFQLQHQQLLLILGCEAIESHREAKFDLAAAAVAAAVAAAFGTQLYFSESLDNRIAATAARAWPRALVLTCHMFVYQQISKWKPNSGWPLSQVASATATATASSSRTNHIIMLPFCCDLIIGYGYQLIFGLRANIDCISISILIMAFLEPCSAIPC